MCARSCQRAITQTISSMRYRTENFHIRGCDVRRLINVLEGRARKTKYKLAHKHKQTHEHVWRGEIQTGKCLLIDAIHSVSLFTGQPRYSNIPGFKYSKELLLWQRETQTGIRIASGPTYYPRENGDRVGGSGVTSISFLQVWQYVKSALLVVDKCFWTYASAAGSLRSTLKYK